MYSLKKFSHFWNRSLLARIRLDIKREKGEGRRRRKRKRRRKRRGAMAPSRVTSFGLSVRKNEPFGWFAGCHRQFSLVRERPQAVSTRPLGLIDQPGCFRPLGRPRCCGCRSACCRCRHGSLLPREIDHSRRTGDYMLYACMEMYITCSTDDILQSARE